MGLSKEELAYGQQKNREYCWEDAKRQFEINNGVKYSAIKDEDNENLNELYIYFCKKSNITPW